MTNTATRRAAALVLTGIVGLAAVGCGSSGQTAQAQGQRITNSAYQKFSSAVPYPYTNNAPTDPLERQNLSHRLQQYNSRGNTNYVYVFTFSGTAIGYYVIRGKVSSTGSQMTATQTIENCAADKGGSCTAVEAMGDDGSYGPNEGGGMGVFFFTVDGTLVETDQPFLVSSTPIPVYAHVPQLDAPAK